MNNNRLIFLDIAKGIGILLVVIGHLLNSSSLPGMYIYQFHMPFFFLISGYCYNQAKYTGHLRTYINVRGLQLLVPLACFNLLIMCCNFQIFHDYTAEIFADHMIGATWFLLVLFGASILFSIIDNVTSIIFKAGILVIFLAWGCALSHYEINPPYGIASVPSATFYFGIGNLLKRRNTFSLMFNKSNSFKAMLCIIAFMLMSYVSFSRIDCIALPEYISFFSAMIPFAGITLSFLLSNLISHSNKCSKILSWVGQNTMAILCTHLFFLSLCCEFIKPLVFSYFLYKLIELFLVFSASFISAIAVKRYCPFMIGKCLIK